MYGKFFASTFTGSMYGSGPYCFALWGYVIATASPAGTVELNPAFVAPIIGTSVEKLNAALALLISPDPHSRSQAEDGRRLVHEGAFQYRVVNHAHYRAMRNEEERRAYNREAKRRERERKSADVIPPVNDCQACQPSQSQSQSQSQKEEDKSLVPLDHATGGLLGLWNATVTKLPKAQKLTAERRRHAAARLKDEPDLGAWKAAILRLEASAFATGENDRGWRADFDFLIRPGTLTKVLEGKYDNRPTPMFATVGKTAGNMAALQAVLSPKGVARVGR
jgi:hypothetical protein